MEKNYIYNIQVNSIEANLDSDKIDYPQEFVLYYETKDLKIQDLKDEVMVYLEQESNTDTDDYFNLEITDVDFTFSVKDAMLDKIEKLIQTNFTVALSLNVTTTSEDILNAFKKYHHTDELEVAKMEAKHLLQSYATKATVLGPFVGQYEGKEEPESYLIFTEDLSLATEIQDLAAKGFGQEEIYIFDIGTSLSYVGTTPDPEGYSTKISNDTHIALDFSGALTQGLPITEATNGRYLTSMLFTRVNNTWEEFKHEIEEDASYVESDSQDALIDIAYFFTIKNLKTTDVDTVRHDLTQFAQELKNKFKEDKIYVDVLLDSYYAPTEGRYQDGYAEFTLENINQMKNENQQFNKSKLDLAMETLVIKAELEECGYETFDFIGENILQLNKQENGRTVELYLDLEEMAFYKIDSSTGEHVDVPLTPKEKVSLESLGFTSEDKLEEKVKNQFKKEEHMKKPLDPLKTIKENETFAGFDIAHLSWISKPLSEIKPGMYVSGLRSKTPRHVYSTEVLEDGDILLMEELDGNISKYLENSPTHVLDVLCYNGEVIIDLHEGMEEQLTEAAQPSKDYFRIKLPTPLTKMEAEMYNAVIGQSSDGMWENSTNKKNTAFWKLAEQAEEGDNGVLFKDFASNYGYNHKYFEYDVYDLVSNETRRTPYGDNWATDIMKYVVGKLKAIVRRYKEDYSDEYTPETEIGYLSYSKESPTEAQVKEFAQKLLQGTYDNFETDEKRTATESTLNERYWPHKEPRGKEIRDAIESGNHEKILQLVHQVAKDWAAKIEPDEDGLLTELYQITDGEWDLDEETLSEFGYESMEELVDERLEALYDAFDEYGIWLSLPMEEATLTEATNKVKTAEDWKDEIEAKLQKMNSDYYLEQYSLPTNWEFAVYAKDKKKVDALIDTLNKEKGVIAKFRKEINPDWFLYYIEVDAPTEEDMEYLMHSARREFGLKESNRAILEGTGNFKMSKYGLPTFARLANDVEDEDSVDYAILEQDFSDVKEQADAFNNSLNELAEQLVDELAPDLDDEDNVYVAMALAQELSLEVIPGYYSGFTLIIDTYTDIPTVYGITQATVDKIYNALKQKAVEAAQQIASDYGLKSIGIAWQASNGETAYKVNESTQLFYGHKENTEEADDILFALQVKFGRPEGSYEYFRTMNLSKEDIQDALNYVKSKGLNKATYFDMDPYEDPTDTLEESVGDLPKEGWYAVTIHKDTEFIDWFQFETIEEAEEFVLGMEEQDAQKERTGYEYNIEQIK